MQRWSSFSRKTHSRHREIAQAIVAIQKLEKTWIAAPLRGSQ
jgi:hypothetical protein